MTGLNPKRDKLLEIAVSGCLLRIYFGRSVNARIVGDHHQRQLGYGGRWRRICDQKGQVDIRQVRNVYFVLVMFAVISHQQAWMNGV